MIFMGLRRIKNKVFRRFERVEEIDYAAEKNRILSANRKYLTNYSFDSEPLVSIIVLNRNGVEYLKILFDDFEKKTNYSNYEIIAVDNASDDESVEYLKSLDMDIRIIENKENLSFSKANNDASDIANGEYILFLNNDIEPTFGWLNEMVGTMIYNENIGAVGAKLIFPHILDAKKERRSFTIQHYGGIFREHVCDQFDYAARHQDKFARNIFDKKFQNNKKCIIATAAVFLIRKDTFFELDRFDESYWYGFEDVDLNLKLYENGYDVVVASSALLLHYESVTRKKEKRQNYVVLNDKWGDFLFRELLNDKIKRNYLLTDKKLCFSFIVKGSAKKFRQPRKIKNAVSYLNSYGYEAGVIGDSQLNVGRKTDVLVSTTIDYDIDDVEARDNLIRVLLLTDDNFNKNKCLNYDIVISDKPNDMPNLYPIDNLDDLGENLISILNSHYLIKK